jgi:hypothetical protein
MGVFGKYITNNMQDISHLKLEIDIHTIYHNLSQNYMLASCGVLFCFAVLSSEHGHIDLTCSLNRLSHHWLRTTTVVRASTAIGCGIWIERSATTSMVCAWGR